MECTRLSSHLVRSLKTLPWTATSVVTWIPRRTKRNCQLIIASDACVNPRKRLANMIKVHRCEFKVSGFDY